jgi:hypothetical protein
MCGVDELLLILEQKIGYDSAEALVRQRRN